MEGIDKLFTVTDYSTVTISIPKSHVDGGSKDEDGAVKITLACSEAATTDYDLTGQILWPVSILLGHYLASSRGRRLLQKRNVIELGAGVGLAGLVASQMDANQVMLTDGNDIVLELLRQNCESKSNAKVAKLVWGDRDDLTNVLRELTHVDVVVAADVVQWPAVVEPLLHTVKALLWSSECETPMFVVGIVNRAQSTYDMFFEQATKLGFSYRRVPYIEFLKDGVCPELCQEHGGRVTEVWEVQSVQSTPPVLFQPTQDNSDDPTLGSAYQQMSVLPC